MDVSEASSLNTAAHMRVSVEWLSSGLGGCHELLAHHMESSVVWESAVVARDLDFWLELLDPASWCEFPALC